MATEAAERCQAELDLLLAMYPDCLSFSPRARELKYSHRSDDAAGRQLPAVLLLRLPDAYPLDGFPEVLSATGHYKEDLRRAAKTAFGSVAAPAGEEVLDALLLAFGDLVSAQGDPRHEPGAPETEQAGSIGAGGLAHRTVIIWAHHLLNTNKRKLALTPSTAGSKISGVTKPGYPGVLIFSGQRSAVESHILQLRNQRWQAFQVRYDTDDNSAPSERWRFHHGEGIREVESMSEVVQSIVDHQQRELFLTSIGVK